ncbi:hypothetical protein [Lactococcus lactis]|uniref:Uncharacterized protein n=1 Tax=Lactococcus lactis subsp. lactis TaxID=1360 RepID=A0A0V8E0K2_LACLL|nr:hypothetical protein [Lactococcus lactis]KSU19292.1 hypothetical protein M20_2096 [Lactococcus lactis subsp. lactis]
MSDKFNAFNKAKEEIQNRPHVSTSLPQFKKKENKKQVTIMLEPNQKERGKELADMTGMSFSELIGYLIDNAK